MSGNDEYIVEILESVGLISHDQGATALTVASQEDKDVVDVLSAEGTVNKLDVLKALANQFGEEDFTALFHQGRSGNLQLSLVHERALLTLRFDEGLTIREIADVLETPHTTIQSRLQSTVRTLRARLGEFSGEVPR